MAKKQKRKVASNRPAVQPRPEAAASPAVSPAASRPAASAAASRSSYNQEFNPDYHLVVQDLKKIGIMAVSFIGLLVVLSFFLR
jgi:BRCT domain type II-containing protein